MKIKTKVYKNAPSIRFKEGASVGYKLTLPAVKLSPNKELSVLETKLVELIPRGIERLVKIKDLEKLCHAKDREIQNAVHSLTRKGVPICSLRSGKDLSGYFIPTNEKELEVGTKAIERQAIEMVKRVAFVKKADLDNWDKGLKRNYQESLNVEE